MTGDIVIFGGLLLDRYFQIDRWPERSQDGFFTDEQCFVGGCAINMAVTAANLGARVHVVSALGDDNTGRNIRYYLKEHNLSDRYLFETKGAAGSCLVFSEPDGERTFLTRKGVEGDFPEDLSEKIIRDGANAAGVTGYYLLNPDAGRVLECLQKLKEQGTKILFDPSPLVGDIDPEYLKKIVHLADVLTPNESEMKALGGEEEITHLANAGKTIVYKKGASGGNVYTPTVSFEYQAKICKAVDTTGAGDSFAGALVYALAENLQIAQSIHLAAECAARTVGVFGPHGFWRL